jgi:hypothetical protein
MTDAPKLPSRAAGPSYGFSIRTHLLRLIAAVILPMLVLAGVLAWYYGSAARQTIEAERLDVANNLANLLDREIGALGGFLNGLSISPGFRSGDAAASRCWRCSTAPARRRWSCRRRRRTCWSPAPPPESPR